MITDAIHDYVAGQLSRLWSLPKPQRRARQPAAGRTGKAAAGYRPRTRRAAGAVGMLFAGNAGKLSGPQCSLGGRVGGLPCPDSLRPAPAGRREHFHE